MNSEPTTPESAPRAAQPAAAPGEQLSAWLDGEVAGPAADALMADLLRRGPWKRQFDEWCLVGDALRSQEVLAEDSPLLCARICSALRDEPALLAPQALAPRRARPSAMARHVASGAGIAAAAAVLVFLALPQLRDANPAPAGAAVANAGAAGKDAPALALASGAAPVAAPKPNPRLDPYIQAHRDFTGAGVMPAAAVYLRFGNEGEK
jgi:sigma-E factor negative regulatory protein RseA